MGQHEESLVEAKNESSTEYKIGIKVTSKETCLGRRLREQEETSWKMDVQCVQSHQVPNISETKHTNNKEENTETVADKAETKYTKETIEKFEQVIKSSQDEEEEVYWRIKQNVKKKRRRKTTSVSETVDEQD